jgi:hypothetical protein
MKADGEFRRERPERGVYAASPPENPRCRTKDASDRNFEFRSGVNAALRRGPIAKELP